MLNKNYTTIERIIAKIDNDFNPDNSDWIPRVGAWTVDAMNMLKVLRKEDKKVKLVVKDKLVYTPCSIKGVDFTLYDKNGCKITEAKGVNGCNQFMDDYPSTGEGVDINIIDTTGTNTTSIIYNESANKAPNVISEHINSNDINSRYNVKHYSNIEQNVNKHYVVSKDNVLELNFDTDYIYIITKQVRTYYSNVYNCELPIIPNNGILIEAITYFCMYKMLCRGYTHPVFNLHASQYGTNPFYQWNQLKDEAKRSVVLDEQGEVIEDNGLWQSALYVNTFKP